MRANARTLLCLRTPLVVTLRHGVSPTHIVRLVATVVVGAIKRQAIRRIEHVSVESLKVVAIVVVDGDGLLAAAVVGIVFVVRVEAALFHMLPSVICASVVTSDGMAVLCVAFSR